VRERRAAQLAARGLVVKSPHGDFTLPQVRALRREQIDGPYDLVLLTAKSYDLDDAIESLRPAVGPATVVLPVLNGLQHLQRLEAAFGAERVAGGLCVIPATLTRDGDVVQLGAPHRIVFGRLPGTAASAQPLLEALLAAFARTPVQAQLAEAVMQDLWEKFVGLTTLAAMTCLMRAAVGDIVAADEGAALMEETLSACAATAAAHGHAPRPAALAGYRSMLLAPGSPFTASMLRDLEGGGRTEADAIVGDMLRRARSHGIDPGPLRLAWCHLQAAEHRRVREGTAAT
jgi:2-dehydropantoate 2-reductase